MIIPSSGEPFEKPTPHRDLGGGLHEYWDTGQIGGMAGDSRSSASLLTGSEESIVYPDLPAEAQPSANSAEVHTSRSQGAAYAAQARAGMAATRAAAGEQPQLPMTPPQPDVLLTPPPEIPTPRPLYEAGDRTLDRFQRIDALARTQNFLPATKREQSEATGLLSVIGRPGGAAKHLSEVVRHQIKHDAVDPQAALRSITRGYINYALDGRQRLQELQALKEALVDVNPTLVLDRVVGSDQPGVLAFMRYFDLSVLRQTGGIEAIGYDPQSMEYAPDNLEVMQQAGDAIKTWRVHQVRQQLPQALADQDARVDFFVARLEEVQKSSPKSLRGIAKEGLDKIHGFAQAS